MIYFINVILLILPLAFVFNIVYMFELRSFLKSLEDNQNEAWIEMGCPKLGSASRSVAFPLLFGRFKYYELLNDAQKSAYSRLRLYLITLCSYWVISIPFFLTVDYSSISS